MGTSPMASPMVFTTPWLLCATGAREVAPSGEATAGSVLAVPLHPREEDASARARGRERRRGDFVIIGDLRGPLCPRGEARVWRGWVKVRKTGGFAGSAAGSRGVGRSGLRTRLEGTCTGRRTRKRTSCRVPTPSLDKASSYSFSCSCAYPRVSSSSERPRSRKGGPLGTRPFPSGARWRWSPTPRAHRLLRTRSAGPLWTPKAFTHEEGLGHRRVPVRSCKRRDAVTVEPQCVHARGGTRSLSSPGAFTQEEGRGHCRVLVRSRKRRDAVTVESRCVHASGRTPALSTPNAFMQEEGLGHRRPPVRSPMRRTAATLDTHRVLP